MSRLSLTSAIKHVYQRARSPAASTDHYSAQRHGNVSSTTVNRSGRVAGQGSLTVTWPNKNASRDSSDDLDKLADEFFAKGHHGSANPDVTISDVSIPPAVDSTETAASSSFGYLRTLLGSTLWSMAGTGDASSNQAASEPVAATKPKPSPKKKALTREQLAQRARAMAITRSQLEDTCKGFLLRLNTTESLPDRIQLLLAMNNMFMQHPDLASLAAEHGVHGSLLRLMDASQNEEEGQLLRVCMSLVGWVPAPRGRGIRILSIDGGGTRGMISLEILEVLEQELGGRPLHQMFDLFIGVSTGSIMSALLGAYQLKISECKEIYREISTRLFAQTRLSGMSGLLWSHSYYNTTEWIKLLKATLGTSSMMESTKKPGAPKLAYLSCVVNTSKMEPFVFRNYAHPPDQPPTYLGSCKYDTWRALQASAAAPGYFEEVLLDNLVHQDGGVLVNNPTAVGLTEARGLWPDAPIQTVLSIGNGRSMLSIPTHPDDNVVKLATSTSLADKIVKIVDSATDTELVHQAMTCLLDPSCYYRINPYMSHMYTLDEIDPAKLAQMEIDAQMYIRRNRPKIRQIAKSLSVPRSRTQLLMDSGRTKLVTKFGYELGWV